MKSKLQSEG